MCIFIQVTVKIVRYLICQESAKYIAQRYCTVLLHCFTAKIAQVLLKAKEKLEKFPRFQEALEELGNERCLNDSAASDFKQFVCILCIVIHE